MSRFLLPLCFLLLLSSACSSGRTTTTVRTAVEQALLSQAADDSITQMNFAGMSGKTYCLKKDFFAATDGEYLLGALNRRMLEAGMAAADGDSTVTSNVIAYPTVAHAAIDDNSLLIGIPEIPLTIPGLGNVTIPEIALFKYATQNARNRMAVFAKDNKTKKLVFETETVTGEKYFNRYVVLFVIQYRTTNLKGPH